MKTKFTKAQLKEWTDALRSGRYRQGRGYLRTTPIPNEDPQFCCLGVLCDLHKDELIEDVNPYTAVQSYNGEESQLPQKLQDKFGISETGRLAESITAKNLASLNDSGFTFDEIAEIIEENFETVDYPKETL